jgi:hypothetical protein
MIHRAVGWPDLDVPGGTEVRYMLHECPLGKPEKIVVSRWAIHPDGVRRLDERIFATSIEAQAARPEGYLVVPRLLGPDNPLALAATWIARS